MWLWSGIHQGANSSSSALIVIFTILSALVASAIIARYMRSAASTTSTSTSARAAASSPAAAASSSTELLIVPPSDPVLGNIPDFNKHGSFHHYLTFLHKHYGDCVGFYWGTTVVVSISAAHFRSTLHLHDRPQLLFELFLPMIGADSIQYASGDDYKQRKRNYVSRAFGHTAVTAYTQSFLTIAANNITKWQSEMDKTGSRSFRLALHSHMLTLSFQAICTTAFGSSRTATQLQVFKQAYDAVWHYLESQIDGSAVSGVGGISEQSYKQQLEVMKSAVLAIIRERREAIQAANTDGNSGSTAPTDSGGAFIDALLDANVSDSMIYSETLTFLVGGFHTTGNMLTWLFYYLAIHPQQQARVRQEIIQVGGGETMSAAQLPQLRYLRQVMDETLRLSALATFAARQSESPITLSNGVVIPPSTPIVQPLGFALHDDRIWTRPDVFDPDRFDPNLKVTNPKVDSSIAKLAFSPFGLSGGRTCPGREFAYAECALITACYLAIFEVRLEQETAEVVQSKFGLVAYPSTEIYVTMRRVGHGTDS